MDLGDTEFAAYVAGLGVGSIHDTLDFKFEYTAEDVSTHSIIHTLLSPYEASHPETLLTHFLGIRVTIDHIGHGQLGSALIIRSKDSVTAQTGYTITLSGVLSRDGATGTGRKTMRSINLCAIEIGNNLIEAVRTGRMPVGIDLETSTYVFNVLKREANTSPTTPTTRAPTQPPPRPWHC